MTQPYRGLASPWKDRRRITRIKTYIGIVTCAAVLIGAAATLTVTMPWASELDPSTQSGRYLGVYEPDAPGSYAGVDQFAQAIGTQPNLVTYYSHWLDPFQASFATAAAEHGAITLVQLAPRNIPITSIASGQFDSYLRSYATEVKAFRKQVILSFGHEMNGNWYSWGYEHTPPGAFVAAWRHIVTVFRAVGVRNVTWLWTINIIGNDSHMTSDPASWWPGSSYVNWVGIDGYYYSKSESFAQIFGPTIVDVRMLTSDPIIIAETGASVAAGQSAKITDLFTGIQTYGLLGVVWFDANDTAQGLYWRLTDKAALAAFSRAAKTFMRPLRSDSVSKS
jgi:mannan endo-1,4-beta-mannosidase